MPLPEKVTSDTWLIQTSGATEVYSGTNNLLVLVEINEGSFCSSDDPAMRYSTAASMHSSLQNDSNTTGNLSVGDTRPNIKLFF